MIKFPFYKLSPGGNMTVILEGRPPEAPVRARVAAAVLSPGHLGAEQMGFADFAAPRLEMAGGEFCVNALRCMGVLLARRGMLRAEGQVWRGEAHCSGLPDPAEATVAPAPGPRPEKTCSGAGRADMGARGGEAPDWALTGCVFESSVEFALDARVEAVAAHPGLNIVFLPGIVHLLLERGIMPMPAGRAEQAALAAALRRDYGLEGHGAVGCVWWSGEGGGYAIDPLVWVREPESLCLENSCGSGSLALALLKRKESSRLSVMQPGGSPLFAGVEERNGRLRAFVGGSVALAAQGEVFIP